MRFHRYSISTRLIWRVDERKIFTEEHSKPGLPLQMWKGNHLTYEQNNISAFARVSTSSQNFSRWATEIHETRLNRQTFTYSTVWIPPAFFYVEHWTTHHAFPKHSIIIIAVIITQEKQICLPFHYAEIRLTSSVSVRGSLPSKLENIRTESVKLSHPAKPIRTGSWE